MRYIRSRFKLTVISSTFIWTSEWVQELQEPQTLIRARVEPRALRVGPRLTTTTEHLVQHSPLFLLRCTYVMSDVEASNKEGDRPTDLAHPQAINATALKRHLTLLAIKLLRRFRKRKGTVLFLSDKICVKYGKSVNLGEAMTMQFIAKHTSIQFLTSTVLLGIATRHTS